MNIDIANRLVSLRKQKGFSQEELAEKLGISRQAISKWERAESSPDTDNLILLAKLYNVSLDELLKTEYDVSPRSNDPIVFNEEEKTKAYFSSDILKRFPIGVVCAAIYLCLGFIFNLWHPGWIVFLLVPIFDWFINVAGDNRK